MGKIIDGKCRWTFNLAAGSFFWRAPVANVHIFALGGGGAANQPYCYSGGGYYAQGNYTMTAGTSYTVVVGAGGAGGGSGGPSVGSTGGSSGVTGVATANGGLGGSTTSGGADTHRNGGAGGSGGGCGAYSDPSFLGGIQYRHDDRIKSS